MKAVILDGFDTLARITRRQRPFKVFPLSRKDPRSFYSHLYANDLTLAQMAAMYRLDSQSLHAGLEMLQEELESIEVFPETMNFLRLLDKHKVTWRVATNIATPYCDPLVHALGISKSRCIFSCKVGQMKPYPQFFERVMKSLGAERDHILMIHHESPDNRLWSARCANTYSIKRPDRDLMSALPLIGIHC